MAMCFRKSLIAAAFGLLLLQLTASAQQRETMRFQGNEREYWLVVPDSLCAARPLVFMLHGYGGKAEGYFPAMAECARRHGFVLCCPQGLQGPGRKPNTTSPGWNVGYSFQQGWKVDDIAFICALERKLQKRFKLNPKNAFFSGMSNGGEMCYLMAYKHPERFAAFASLAGLTMEWTYRSLEPRGPVPFMEVHGTADRTSEWNGDPENAGNWGAYVGVPQAVGRMVSVNCCTHELCDTLKLFTPESNKVILHRYVGGTGGNEVRLYEVVGGKHTKAEKDMDTAEEVWKFFEKFVSL